jgi:RND family efflux transporter MFP subunit
MSRARLALAAAPATLALLAAAWLAMPAAAQTLAIAPTGPVVGGAALVVAQPVAAEPGGVPVTGAAVSGDSVRVLVTPRRFTTLAAELGARVDKLPVAEGATFAAGELLVAFECSSQSAQLARAKAALDAARKTLAANERLLQLNAVGQLELDVARTEADKAAADAALYESVVGKCRIAAPFAGRVVEQKAREQQFVQAGQTLLEILDDSVLELEFIAPSRWLGWLRNGQAFRVRIDETGRTYPARVLRIGAKVDPVSQSVKLVGAVDGRFPELLAGMSGRASFVAGKRHD